ncbi:MAG: FG-GAP repeat protein [Pseudomonadota bacterium]
MHLNKNLFRACSSLIIGTLLFWLGPMGCTEGQKSDSPPDLSQLEDIQIEGLIPEGPGPGDIILPPGDDEEDEESAVVREFGAPQNLKAITGYGEATITWDPVFEADSYVIHKASPERVLAEALGETAEASFVYRPRTLIGLPHTIVVKAISSVHGESPFSERLTFNMFTALSSEAEILTGRTAPPENIKVAINENKVAVGVCNPGEPGKVYIYNARVVADRVGWSIEQVIDNAAAGFGCALDIIENCLVVGAPNQDTTGAAYIYSKLAAGWTLTDTLTPSESLILEQDEFGFAISIKDNYILIGAPNSRVGENAGAGAVYLFERQDIAMVRGTYTARFLNRFISPSPETSAKFGSAVELYIKGISTSKRLPFPGLSAEPDRLALIGSPYTDVGSKVDAGKAYFFNFMANGRMQGHIHELSAQEEAYAHAHFGSSVSLTMPDPWYILVGAPGQPEIPGAAFLFYKNEAGTTEKLTKISGPGARTNHSDLFGYDVLIKDNLGFISVPAYNLGVVHAYFIHPDLLAELEEARRGGVIVELGDAGDEEEGGAGRIIIEGDESGVEERIAALISPALMFGGFEPADVPAGSLVGESIAYDKSEIGLLISGPLGLAEPPERYPLVYVYDIIESAFFDIGGRP